MEKLQLDPALPATASSPHLFVNHTTQLRPTTPATDHNTLFLLATSLCHARPETIKSSITKNLVELLDDNPGLSSHAPNGQLVLSRTLRTGASAGTKGKQSGSRWLQSGALWLLFYKLCLPRSRTSPDGFRSTRVGLDDGVGGGYVVGVSDVAESHGDGRRVGVFFPNEVGGDHPVVKVARVLPVRVRSTV